MKKLFYAGLIALGIFEVAKVYFIMPMPGSQEMNTIDLAYFLHTSRWWIRGVLAVVMLAGATHAFKTKPKWIPITSLVVLLALIYFMNFIGTADRMFLEPETLDFRSRAENLLIDSTLVLVVSHEGDAKAYPIRFIVYHHQVRDTVGGKPIMVTYCSVCRTGRVFEPIVNGKPENFRLVGMDHFNAMFEDQTTGSWWQQSTGAAITGALKGIVLPEIPSAQVTLGKFFNLYPFGKVMQPEEVSKENYDSLGRYEKGKGKSHLTRTDTLSWQDKSWVVGVQIANHSKAYDWRDFRKHGVIHDNIGEIPIVIVLSDDGQSFSAVQRNSNEEIFIVRNDSLVSEKDQYDFLGRAKNGTDLKVVNAYQEFWHSWKTFHADTEIYSADINNDGR